MATGAEHIAIVVRPGPLSIMPTWVGLRLVGGAAVRPPRVARIGPRGAIVFRVLERVRFQEPELRREEPLHPEGAVAVCDDPRLPPRRILEFVCGVDRSVARVVGIRLTVVLAVANPPDKSPWFGEHLERQVAHAAAVLGSAAIHRLTFDATPVPEPAGILLFGTAVLAALRRRNGA